MIKRREYTVQVAESVEGGYVASCVEMPGYTAEGETRESARTGLIAALRHVAEEEGWELFVIKPPDLRWSWTTQFGEDEPVRYGDEPASRSEQSREAALY